MKYTIQSVQPNPRQFQSKFGDMVAYMVEGLGEDNVTKAGEMIQKVESPPPKAGDILEGEFEVTKFGMKFIKARKAGFGGRPFDPEAMMRANALNNALAYTTKKAELLGQDDVKKALKYFTGEHVMEVATYFMKFHKGDPTVGDPKKAIESEQKEVDLDDLLDKEGE